MIDSPDDNQQRAAEELAIHCRAIRELELKEQLAITRKDWPAATFLQRSRLEQQKRYDVALRQVLGGASLHREENEIYE